jgi:hypothetical protein
MEKSSRVVAQVAQVALTPGAQGFPKPADRSQLGRVARSLGATIARGFEGGRSGSHALWAWLREGVDGRTSRATPNKATTPIIFRIRI